ncbi:phosphoribosylaminoimidazolecarboxamide formyltransferase [bacterium]|nr:phosphoribosylaminoimidazolecarboxamide formyltransferase [bacterium]
MEIKCRYGTNPHQNAARLVYEGEGEPFKVLNGAPSMINLLDALGAWPLARELKEATGLPGAASFKHVSPAGAAIAKPIDAALRESQFLPEEELSPVATAYVRARAGDRLCSFGDVGAVSDVVDVSLAKVLAREVSDAIVAPGYEPEALEILKAKKKGKYLVMQIDPSYEPPAMESRENYGFTLEQEANRAKVTRELLANVVTARKEIPEDVVQTLLVTTIAVKYTQSNTVGLGYDGQVIGMGAGQQSRIHCTRLACGKAEKWLLQQHPKVTGLPFKPDTGRVDKTSAVDYYLLWDELSDAEMEFLLSFLAEKPEPLTADERHEWIFRHDGIALSSDAFIPFRDNLDRASRTHVQYVVQPGGAVRDDLVTEAADGYGMVMAHSGIRWFLH